MILIVWYMDKEQTADGDRARKVTVVQNIIKYYTIWYFI